MTREEIMKTLLSATETKEEYESYKKALEQDYAILDSEIEKARKENKKIYAANGRRKTFEEIGRDRKWQKDAHITRITHEWREHIPFGGEYTDGIIHIKTPKEKGCYTLYTFVNRSGSVEGYEWECERERGDRNDRETERIK